MTFHRSILRLTGALALSGLAGCALPVPEGEEDEAEALQAQASALQSTGRRLFSEALPHTNGRSCATCHVLAESTALSPANVQARLAANPQDPLFHRIDADDPDAAVPTYEHLKKGLVRVVLPLPANMDVIDNDGNVITPPDRKVAVWRGVPSIENTAISGPYQLDGRVSNLPEQAQAAITSHSEGGTVPPWQLNLIADFQRSVFSSPRARFVSELLDHGVPVDEIPFPEDYMPLNAQERRGREVFKLACSGCHGGATTTRITNRAIHAISFFALNPDGTVPHTVVPGQPPAPVRVQHPNSEFINLGVGGFTYLGQIGQFPAYNASLEMPRYRFRFYTDGTRQHPLTELPPIPVTASGDPYDPNPALDENGAPIVGPNLIPQWFTTDPGRALITGDPRDFEAFDMPPLRGVARTAPYFHDNNHETLRDVVDSYSRFFLPFTGPLNLPPVHPPEFPGAPPESLSTAQKQDLLQFLNRL